MAAADKTLTLALAHDLAEILVPILREKMETAAPVQQVLFNIPEAARILGCSKRALESIIHEREIVVVRRGRRVYIHKRDLDAYIEKNRV
jgi:excisionase family DNA binding protein